METTHKYIAHGETPTNSNFYSLPVHVVSPINVLVLCKYLTSHPDRNFVNFLLDGFTNGFSVGYQGPLTAGQCRNLLSARSNPAAVTRAISKEVERGHTAGPFDIMPFPLLHCSPLGAVPKKDGTYRIILDLSSPRGSAINEGISPETYSVRYSSFDDAVNMVLSVGAGGSCYMAKLDIQHAFRLCPVHPSDWPLLGYQWLGKYFVDVRLPFGSRSSPFIFNQFAEALLWILMCIFGILHIVHYLDDFFICSTTMSGCQHDMETMQSAFSELGVPLAPEKLLVLPLISHILVSKLILTVVLFAYLLKNSLSYPEHCKVGPIEKSVPNASYYP